ncbi:MAG: thioredoxin-like domain-containing protein [Pirellulales bacterium]|nr:thioredoxin-like domain-containing protein [Pirellulales bacterium]
MSRAWRWLVPGSAVVVAGAIATNDLAAQNPTATQALKLVPIHQRDVVIDQPAAAELDQCTIKSEKTGVQSGYVVRNPRGLILREFVDTNNDNVVDRWSYYKDGIEVYRDIDENFDGKADQHRWLNTAGTRWGVDKNQDGQIDAWKSISPEEVTAELVAAIRTADAQRYGRLLLTTAELKSLGLGDTLQAELSAKLAAAPAGFAAFVKSQKLITPDSTWVDFAAGTPGMVPAGTHGSTADVTAYEHAIAMIETAGKSGQLPVGTLVQAGPVWRLIEAPTSESTAGTFFHGSQSGLTGTDAAAASAPNEAMAKLIEEVQKIDAQINQTAAPAELIQLNDRRADLLAQVAEMAEPRERGMWTRQMADVLSAAIQAGNYSTGLARLEKLANELETAGTDAETAAFVKYRFLQAEYNSALQGANPDYAKIQANWTEKLTAFAEKYPTSPDAADALLQLGNAAEFAGQEEPAKEWYKKLVANFAGTAAAKKAAGAITRLDCVGRQFNLAGKALGNGAAVDLAKYKGKVVLIHYWATWSEPCKVDLAQLKELQAKYGKQGFELIGVNLDENAETAVEFLTANRLPWVQLHEQGGLDSRLANEIGVLNLPLMLLVDETGKVANRGIHITELETELRKKLRLDQAARPKGK